MGRARRSVAVIALLLCAAVHRAAAQPAEDPAVNAEARRHFDAGSAFYGRGQYREAIVEFEAGYALSHRPLFLLNLGQAYRRLDDLERAERMYARFLETAPADAPERPAVRSVLAEVRARRAPQTPAAATVGAPALAAPAPPRRSFVRRHWWIFPVGGVVVAAALGVGIYFALHPPGGLDCGAASLGCVQETR